MAKKVGKIAKEKKPFDKTYIPLTFAFIILALLVGALVYTIIQKPKDKPVMNETNTLQIEEVVVDNKNSTICTNDEIKRLTEEAKKITAKYEEIDDFYYGEGVDLNSEDGHAVPIYGYALRMTLENISDDFSVIINNSVDDKQMVYTSFENGYIQWDEGDTFFIRTYFVDIYSNTDSCNGVKIRSFDFAVPKWNEISKFDICRLDNWKDKEICKHFTYDERSLAEKQSDTHDEAIKEGKKLYKEKEQENENVIIKTLKNRTFIIIAIIVGIIVVGVIIVLLVMKGRKNNEK